MAATVGGDDAVDVNFNWYGNLFNRDVLINAFRNKGNSFDVEAGYSHALFEVGQPHLTFGPGGGVSVQVNH